jgi:hypothetical protein
MREAHQVWADDQVTVSSCAFCDWTHEGTAVEGREEALTHRQSEHPEACIRKPRLRPRRISKRNARTAGEEEQIAVDAAEARRLRTKREQDEMLATIERGRERVRAAQASFDGSSN